MKILIICILAIQLTYAKSSPMDEAVAYIKNLINKKESSDFKVKGCKYQKEKWLALLLTQTQFKEKVTFNKSCYVQGDFLARMNKFFTIPLDLKDKKFSKVKLDMKISMGFDKGMKLKLVFKNGSLTSAKETFRFRGEKSFQIDPLNPKKIIKESIPGKLIVTHKKEKKEIKI